MTADGVLGSVNEFEGLDDLLNAKDFSDFFHGGTRLISGDQSE
jgi:hypothetical protein